MNFLIQNKKNSNEFVKQSFIWPRQQMLNGEVILNLEAIQAGQARKLMKKILTMWKMV